MTRFFTLLALASIPLDMRERARTLVEVSRASWVRQLVDEELSQIQADTVTWAPFLAGVNIAARAPVLGGVLEAAEAEEKERARRQLMAAPLSQERVREFADGVRSAWRRGAYLRALIERGPGIQTTVDPAPKEIEAFGFWRLESKEPFIDDSAGFGVETFGEDFGTALARGEVDALYGTIRRGARTFRLGGKAVPGRLAELIQLMRYQGFPPDVIVVTGRVRELRKLEASSDFTRDIEEIADNSPAEGLFKGIPVYRRQSKGRPEILLVSTQRLGRITQYVSESLEFPRVVIEDYSIEEARQGARERRSEVPAEARDLGEEATVEYLQERVRLRIDEQFELQPATSSVASLLPLK